MHSIPALGSVLCFSVPPFHGRHAPESSEGRRAMSGTTSPTPPHHRSGSHQNGIGPPFFGVALFPFSSNLTYSVESSMAPGDESSGSDPGGSNQGSVLSVALRPSHCPQRGRFTHKSGATSRGWLGWPRSLRLKGKNKGFWLGHLPGGCVKGLALEDGEGKMTPHGLSG